MLYLSLLSLLSNDLFKGQNWTTDAEEGLGLSSDWVGGTVSVDKGLGLADLVVRGAPKSLHHMGTWIINICSFPLRYFWKPRYSFKNF